MFEGLKKSKSQSRRVSTFGFDFSREKEPIGMVEGFLHFCENTSLIIVSSVILKTKEIKTGDVLYSSR